MTGKYRSSGSAVPPKGSMVGILTFLGYGTFVATLLKGVKKEGKDPLLLASVALLDPAVGRGDECSRVLGFLFGPF